MAPTYKLTKDSLQWNFQRSRAKIQLFGGGFGNGKTTSAVVKMLQIARDYPGANILVARSTYPKLTQTIRKEVRKWCPPSWVERDVDSKENLMQLKNGTVINFSHVQQTGKATETSSSNLLSATYDLIVIDQVEDPEITEKDFMDLLGRLRGQTVYQGDDPTMPTTGPRWIIAMCNPTRNWVYRKLVKPLHDYQNGIANLDLMADEDGKPLIELYEGSTYENADNLPADFIKTNEALYKGQMRTRYLLGEWGAYEGLVYSEYDPQVHLMDHSVMLDLFDNLVQFGAYGNVIEAYDHGIASPACYGFAFHDASGNIFILDGLYEKEKTVHQLANGIKSIRNSYGIGSDHNYSDDNNLPIYSDPAIFKRSSGSSKSVGVTVAGLFREEGLQMIRANNEIISGIAKVQSYLYIDPTHPHPLNENALGAPRLFISKKLDWFDKEIVDYYWKKDNVTGDYEDTPTDRNDHAMDMVKYLLTRRPSVLSFRRNQLTLPPHLRRWHEQDLNSNNNTRAHRHGSR